MARKLRLDLPLVLPDVPDTADACVARLTDELERRGGVDKVHIARTANGEPQLCVHFDEDVYSLSRIREVVESCGARLTERFGHALFAVDGIAHQRRARTVVALLRKAPGVLDVQANATGPLHVEFDRSQTDERSLRGALSAIGIQVRKATLDNAPTSMKRDAQRHGDHSDTAAGDHVHRHEHDDHAHGADHGHSHEHGGFLGPNTELIFALACGGSLFLGYTLEKLSIGTSVNLSLLLYLLAFACGGFFTLREAIDNLRLRKFEIDSLMLVAAGGAASLGAWAEGALLLFLFSLGHALEHYAMGRAKQAIEALAKLAPQTAQLIKDGQATEIPVEQLAVGDTVLVRPNERVPADGFVIKGASSINQAPVTGESIPVDKRPVEDVALARSRPALVDAVSRVFAGTINGSGAIEVEVTRRSGDSALAKVVQMVNEAETQKSPTQRFTDRFERIFVPAVVAVAILLLFAWVVIDEPFRDSFYRAMAVLVAASPCALAIATPSAVLSGVARAARGGVLIKGGAPLENLGSLTSIAFDKTGTLTVGQPRITDLVPCHEISEQGLLSVAVAVERLSDHPLALAIAKDGAARLKGAPPLEAQNLRSLTGRGVIAEVSGKPVWIGKAEMFGTDDVPSLSEEAKIAVAKLRDKGRTTMVVRHGGQDLGVIGLMDTPRASARQTLDRLRALGIKKLIMISGDHQKVAEAIAREVGIDEARGDLMPADKVTTIRELGTHSKVAMVGDGVNDAPAIANATVGIAMGAAGSDVALETADVALMADELAHLPFAVGLSRATRRVILQNVVVSLGVVAVLVPATLLGLGIGPAVAMHEGSTILVVINALRLLVWNDPTG